MSKHIFLGSERISTKVRELSDNPDYEQTNTTVEKDNIYYYHSDHLGSAQTVTNGKGELYERLEYTPYGEVWLDESAPYVEFAHLFETPYRFTAKELDEETGLYYYGARYLDPKYSRWISTDPALAEYIPSAPINDEAKKRNQNLPGMGGIFNTTNCGLYHYAANNPVKYTDPDGREHGIPYEVQKILDKLPQAPVLFDQNLWTEDRDFKATFSSKACFATSILNTVSMKYTSVTGKALTLEQGINALHSAIDNSFINSEEAYVGNIEGAATSMLHYLGLNFHAQYTNDDKTDNNNAEFKIYAFASNKDPTKFRHFVNALPGGKYFDVWNKQSGDFYNEDGTTIILLQKGRPIRAFTFVED